MSTIVGHKFPFKGTDAERRFLDWLADKVKPHLKRGFAVCPEEYIKEACDVWTFIHLQLENYIDGNPIDYQNPLYSLHKKEIEGGFKYIDWLKWKGELLTEVVICDDKDRYQGSIDLVIKNEKTKTVYIIDWKTWGVAKKKWKLPNVNTRLLKSGKRSYKKNPDKNKKVELQLSLYWETYRQKGYKIGGIYVAHITEEGCFEVELKPWTSADINSLLTKFMTNEVEGKFPDYNFEVTAPLKIRICTPPQPYFSAEVELDLSKIEDWLPYNEALNQAIATQRKIHNAYLPKD